MEKTMENRIESTTLLGYVMPNVIYIYVYTSSLSHYYYITYVYIHIYIYRYSTMVL